MTFVHYLVSRKPLLKKKLRTAKLDVTPEAYVKKALRIALMSGFGIFAIAFFMMSKNKVTLLPPLVLGIVASLVMYSLTLKKVDVSIRKRAKAIDKEVLFAGRFLLIKLNSGKPLLNAIEEASKGFGAATDYFKEIMREIELGTPLETALERGTEYCPSENLKKILFQITNALKIGVDVTNFLQAILDEISEQQLTAILRYGKKLSSLTMFYMLVAIVVPSLGMTLLIVVASLISLPMDMGSFVVITFFLFILQYIFITMFKSARPNMDV